MSSQAPPLQSRLTTALKEAVLLAVAGSVIGIAYGAVTSKGLFDRAPLPPAVTGTVPDSGPAMIPTEQARALFEADSALFLDTRSEFDFRLGHIQGAVNLPLKSIREGRAVPTTFPRDRILITYCDGASCNSSIEVAAMLSQAGYKNVRIFFAGWEEWQAMGLPVEDQNE